MQRCLGCMREFGEEFDVCPHCGYIVGTGAASKNYLEPGTVLQSRYTLGKVLGQGGFGITYIGWDIAWGDYFIPDLELPEEPRPHQQMGTDAPGVSESA